MRISAKTIYQEGERLSPHSKFYTWHDMLFEPSLYRGKPSKSYKPVTNAIRIRKAFERVSQKTIPTVSSVCPSPQVFNNNKKAVKQNRYAILDLRKD